MAAVTDKGWGFPTRAARKAHYFREDGRSLCGRYGSFGIRTDPETTGASPDDCAACRRRLDAEGVR